MPTQRSTTWERRAIPGRGPIPWPHRNRSASRGVGRAPGSPLHPLCGQAGQGGNTRWRRTGLLQEGCQAIGKRFYRNAALTAHPAPDSWDGTRGCVRPPAVQIRNQAIGNPHHGVKTLRGQLRDLAHKGHMRRENQCIEPTPVLPTSWIMATGSPFTNASAAVLRRSTGSATQPNRSSSISRLRPPITSEAVVITGVAPEDPATVRARALAPRFVAEEPQPQTGRLHRRPPHRDRWSCQPDAAQSVVTPLWPEENELLIAAEEPGNLCR